MNEWINEKLLPPVLNSSIPKQLLPYGTGCFTRCLYHCWFRVSSISEFPSYSYFEWVNASGLAVYFNQAYGASFAIMSLFAVGIAYHM